MIIFFPISRKGKEINDPFKGFFEKRNRWKTNRLPSFAADRGRGG